VVGSDSLVNSQDGRQVRGRAYPWGTIEVDNEAHCDFVKLRQMLVRTHMEELREHTNEILYENYRTEKLRAMGVMQDETVFKETKWVTSTRPSQSRRWRDGLGGADPRSPAVKQAEERAMHEVSE
jgi:septin 7